MKLNDVVCVKLTQLGHEVLKEALGSVPVQSPGVYHGFTLCELMRYFGPHLASGGCPLLFVDDEAMSKRDMALEQIAYRNLPDLDPEDEGRLDDAMRMSRLAREALGIL